MNKRFIVALAAFFMAVTAFSQKKKDLISEVVKLKAQMTEMKTKLSEMQKMKEVDLEDELQKFSYAFGLTIGHNLKTVGYDSLAYQQFATALEDVMIGNEKMNKETAQQHVRTTIEKLQKEEAKRLSKEGEEFLAENGKKPEIISTESGLQYEIVKAGGGATPKSTDKVKVHYSGTTINGKVFDSSIELGEPAIFGVTQVIKGWQEALKLMKVGDKWRVYIPQNLAYGERGGGGGAIPPYAALIFEMELLAIEK